MNEGASDVALILLKSVCRCRTGSSTGSVLPGMGMMISLVQKLLVLPWPRYIYTMLLVKSTEIFRRTNTLSALYFPDFGTALDFRNIP